MATLNPNQQRAFNQFEAALDRYGYFVAAEPIDGMEEVFLNDLRFAFAKVEETASSLRKNWGYRGISKRLLEDLHNTLPAPSFNVESAIAPELRAKERRGRN